MKIFKDPKALQEYIPKIKSDSKKIGFVPTMGAIHKGHLVLIEKSKRQNDITIVSIFVNPKQFNNHDDFLRYPQNFQDDIDKIGNLADILFIPSAESIYKKSNQTTISFSEHDKILEGKYRPGHFQGVALIVCKLLNICQSDHTYVGLKDYQQYLVLKQLVEDLNIQTKIIGVTTVREKSGLAHSSRNTLLSEVDKVNAPSIYEGLEYVRDLVLPKKIKVGRAIKSLTEILNKIPNLKTEYVEIRSKNLETVKYVSRGDIILVAVYLGKIRLIDNIFI